MSLSMTAGLPASHARPSLGIVLYKEIKVLIQAAVNVSLLSYVIFYHKSNNRLKAI